MSSVRSERGLFEHRSSRRRAVQAGGGSALQRWQQPGLRAAFSCFVIPSQHHLRSSQACKPVNDARRRKLECPSSSGRATARCQQVVVMRKLARANCACVATQRQPTVAAGTHRRRRHRHPRTLPPTAASSAAPLPCHKQAACGSASILAAKHTAYHKALLACAGWQYEQQRLRQCQAAGAPAAAPAAAAPAAAGAARALLFSRTAAPGRRHTAPGVPGQQAAAARLAAARCGLTPLSACGAVCLLGKACSARSAEQNRPPAAAAAPAQATAGRRRSSSPTPFCCSTTARICSRTRSASAAAAGGPPRPQPT